MEDGTHSGQGTGMDNGTDLDEVADLDPQRASMILQEARQKARQELSINHPAIYLTWGLVYLIGCGAIWLTVRHEHPYTAPQPAAILGISCSPGWPWPSPRCS